MEELAEAVHNPSPISDRGRAEPSAPDRAMHVERRATRRPTKPGRSGARRRVAAGAAAILVAGVALLVTRSPWALTAGLMLLALVQAVALGRIGGRTSELRRLAHTDELTGLRNARALWSELAPLTAQCPAAVVMLDLDRFKAVNDELGHQVGDVVLRRAAGALREVVGHRGQCYRYGGEELVVVLEGSDEAGARIVAEHVRRRIAHPHSGLPTVTVSAGVAASSPGAEAHHLLDRADVALRCAKRQGRDRVVCASEARPEPGESAAAAARQAAMTIATAALTARDADTADHSEDVVVLCEALADRLGVDGEEREHLLAAARLHDVGKVAIPHEVLAKPGPLDALEWELMREHTVIGERILGAVPELEPVAPIVRHAHERYDGTGYPDGLAGDDIPLTSRIILCADAYHAIRADRPYRAGRGPEEAVRELLAHAGTQFDPTIARALVETVRAASRPGPGLGAAMSRSPRLMALLLTLAVGGTAVAAEPHVRHAVAGVLRGSARPHAVASSGAAAHGSCAALLLTGAGCGPERALAAGPLPPPAAAGPSKAPSWPTRAGGASAPRIPSVLATSAPPPAQRPAAQGGSGQARPHLPRRPPAPTKQSPRLPAPGAGTKPTGGTRPARPPAVQKPHEQHAHLPAPALPEQGKANTAPGQTGAAPGLGGPIPGPPPAPAGDDHGRSGGAPGRTGAAPGRAQAPAGPKQRGPR